MPTYYLAGLMYINGCHGTEDQRVLIPNGSDDPEIQPPLEATILVAEDDYGKHTGFERRERELKVDEKTTATFYEFPLKKRSRVRVPHSGGAECVKLDAGLPRAEDAEFVPNLEDPDTFAEIELGGGTLKARSLAGVPVVEWTVDDKAEAEAETVTITAIATVLDDDGKPTQQEQTLTVKREATVVFVHSSDLFAEAPKQNEAPKRDWNERPDGPPTSESHHEHDYDYSIEAKLYQKIAAKPIDPEKFYAHRKPKEQQPDIPAFEQAASLQFLQDRPAWRFSGPPWCCPNKKPHPSDRD